MPGHGSPRTGRTRGRFSAWRRLRSTSRSVRARYQRPPARSRASRRARRHPGAGRGHRRHRGLPARVERQRRRAVRDERAHRRVVDEARGRGRPLPRLHGRGGDVRREHDLAVVRALTHRGARVEGRATRSSSRASTTTATSRPGSSWPTTSASSCASRTSRTTATSISTDLERQLSERTRVVAFPIASNAVGTLTECAGSSSSRTSAGALAWADAVHAAPHVPTDVQAWDVDVLLCSPYKFFGPHLGVAYARREVAKTLAARTRCDRRPTSRSATASRRERSRSSSSPALSRPSSTSSRSDGRPSRAHERSLGEHFLAGVPAGLTLLRPADDRGPRADVHVHDRRHRARRGRTAPGRAGASRSGRATTTRSRCCDGSELEQTRQAPSAQASSTTTPTPKWIGCSMPCRSWSPAAPRSPLAVRGREHHRRLRRGSRVRSAARSHAALGAHRAAPRWGDHRAHHRCRAAGDRSRATCRARSEPRSGHPVAHSLRTRASQRFPRGAG